MVLRNLFIIIGGMHISGDLFTSIHWAVDVIEITILEGINCMYSTDLNKLFTTVCKNAYGMYSTCWTCYTVHTHSCPVPTSAAGKGHFPSLGAYKKQLRMILASRGNPCINENLKLWTATPSVSVMEAEW